MRDSNSSDGMDEGGAAIGRACVRVLRVACVLRVCCV